MFFCISWLIGALLQGIDLFSLGNLYTVSGPLEKICFRVGRRGNDALLMTIDGEKYELYTDNSDKQGIFEDILDQCGIAYDYDPDYVGEEVEAVINSDLLCEAQLVSTLSRGELILGLKFGGAEYSDFDAAHAAWKSHCTGSAAAFPVGIVIVLLGNRFFKPKKQE